MKYFHMTSKSAVWDKMNDEQRDDWIEYLTPFLDARWEKKCQQWEEEAEDEFMAIGDSIEAVDR